MSSGSVTKCNIHRDPVLDPPSFRFLAELKIGYLLCVKYVTKLATDSNINALYRMYTGSAHRRQCHICIHQVLPSERSAILFLH